MVINQIENDICEYIEYYKYGINKEDELLTIILIGINKINKANGIFSGCKSLLSLLDISKCYVQFLCSFS